MTQQRHSSFITALLVTLTTAGLALIVGGTAVAVYASSPANREGNEFASIGVAAGIEIAALGTLVAVSCATALAVRAHQSR